MSAALRMRAEAYFTVSFQRLSCKKTRISCFDLIWSFIELALTFEGMRDISAQQCMFAAQEKDSEPIFSIAASLTWCRSFGQLAPFLFYTPCGHRTTGNSIDKQEIFQER